MAPSMDTTTITTRGPCMRRLTMTLVAIATLVTVAAVGAFATGCGGNSVPSDAVATVGGVSVTKPTSSSCSLKRRPR